MPLSECQAISQWARSQSPPILLHLDGARLWEAVAAAAASSGAGEGGGPSLKDYCACFNSVSLCFSKGLGAPIGSVIVGNNAFIARARHIRKSLGGGMRQTGIIAGPARVAVEETFLGGKLTMTHERAKKVAKSWEQKGGKLSKRTETNMVWLDLDDAGVSRQRFIEVGLEEGIRFLGARLVIHYQLANEALERLERVMARVLQGRTKLQKEDAAENVKLEAAKIVSTDME